VRAGDLREFLCFGFEKSQRYWGENGKVGIPSGSGAGIKKPEALTSASGALVWKVRPGYFPMMIKAPAAIARTAMTVPIPEKPMFRSGISPIAMSQMPNKSMPTFLVSFMGRLLSLN
jgi:hypothetical protein